jgi:hypothetical protein
LGENSPQAIAETFRAICTQPVHDDGVVFDVNVLEAAPIRENVEYGGIRVRTTATIAGARIRFRWILASGIPSRRARST